MGTATFAVYCALLLLTFCSHLRAEEADLKLGSPDVTEISEFAARSLVEDERFGLKDASLLMVLDARRSIETPNLYVVTLDMGEECVSADCQPSKVCEVHVERVKESGPWSALVDKTRCSQKETRPITDLSGGRIAAKMSPDDVETVGLVESAVEEIARKTDEEVSLLRVVRAREAWDGPSRLVYLTLNVESKKAGQSPTNEVCDVSIEEGFNTADNDVNTRIVRSLHCFTSSDTNSKSSDPDSFFQDQSEEIPVVRLSPLAEAAHALINADSASDFQSNLIGYSLVGSRVSPDTGVRETRVKLGIAPTVCLKGFNEDGAVIQRSCRSVDSDRDAAICTVTATQWPWVEDGYLFSDLACDTATLKRINEELSPVPTDDIVSSVRETESVPSVDDVEEPTFGSNSAFCTGCPRDVSVDSEKIKQLAQFALSAVDSSVNSDKTQAIVGIVKATQQVVSGIKYQLTLAVGDTDCEKTSNDRASCTINSESPVQHCKVTIIEQSWKNRLEVLETVCGAAAGESREARALGGAKDADVTAADVLEMARFALDTLDTFDENDKKRMLVKVLESKKQVVAGTLYTMKLQFSTTDCAESSSSCKTTEGSPIFICQVQVLSQPWEATSKKLLQSKCAPADAKSPRAIPLDSDGPAQPAVEGSFDKVYVSRLGEAGPADPNTHVDLVGAASALSEDFDESPFVGAVPDAFVLGGEIRLASRQKIPGLVGGYTPVDVSDSEVIEMAEFSKTAISSAINAREDVQISTIESAETQVVAGTNYKLKLAVTAGESRHSCEVVVFNQPWTRTRKVTGVSCTPTVSEPEDVVGKFTPDDPNNPKIQQIVAFSLPAIANDFNGGKPVALVQVESAESQVVSGVKYRVKLTVQAENDRYSCRAVIFDQPWVQSNQLTSLSCVPSPPERRSGAYKLQDPRDPKVQEMATFSLQTIAQQVNGGSAVELVKVTSVQTQVVSGVNYKMQMTVGAGQQRHTCEVVVWDQPWTSTRKVIDLACTPLSPAGNGEQDQISRGPGAGGYKTRDPNDAKVQEMAVFSLSTIGQEVNADGALNLIRVVSAETQVVAGVNYKLKLAVGAGSAQHTCEVIVFDQPWTATRKVSSVACVPNAAETTTTEAPSTPKRPSLRGGYSRRDPNEPRIQKMAEFSLTAVGQAINSENPVQLVRIESAETQIVSGTNYRMKLVISSGEDQHSCDVVVWDQPWTKTRQVSSVSCAPVGDIPSANETPSSSARPVGGYSVAKATDPDVQEIAAFSLTAVAQGVNGGELVELIRIESAQRQVVAGTNYKLNLVVGAGSTRHSCEVVVFDQPWTATRKVSSLSCGPSNIAESGNESAILVKRESFKGRLNEGEVDAVTASRPGKQLLGDYSPADPNSPDVKEMAAFSLVAISSGINGGKAVQLIRVEQAATHIVAGVNYRLTLMVSAEQKQLTCNVIIFDQSWTGTREVTDLSCSPKDSSRTRKALPSSPTERRSLDGYAPADASSSDVQKIANVSLSAISRAVNGGKPVQIVRVEEADTQVVAGVNRRLKLVVDAEQNQLACDVFVFDQPWTKSREGTELVCKPKSTDDASNNGIPFLGSPSPADPKDPKVQDIATFSLSTISAALDAGKPVQLVKVEEAATYNHAGVNYILKLIVANENAELLCDVSVSDQSWTGTRNVAKVACLPFAGSRSRRSVRSVPLGGWTDVDVSNNKIHEIANFSLQILNDRSNEHNLLKFTRILKAQRQKVAGLNYKIELEVASVTCSKSAGNESCVIDPSRELQVCAITVWDRPWLNQREVTDLSCKGKKKLTKVKLYRDKNVRRQLVGAPSAVDPNAPEMQEYAALALQALNAQSNEANQLKMVRIKDAAVQVVAGKNVILNMEVGTTTCKKGENGACPLIKAARGQVCTVKIWDRPWLNDRRVTDVKCDAPTSAKSHNRVQRSIVKSPKQKRFKYMNAFRSFMAKHKKVYKNWEEFERRYKIYRENQGKIKELRDNEMGTAVYGDTPFSDLTEDEFKRLYTGLNPALRHPSARPLKKATSPSIPLPEEFDWRTKNAVTPVKNQGQCGSCWAFSVTGNVEGQYAIKNGNLLSFSEQELVDCDKLDNGCNGGLPENAYKAIEELGGLELEEDYPYDGRDEKCHLLQDKTQVQVTGGVEISQNETEMAQWLVQNGPISIGINANGMQFYRGGISHPWKFLCRPGGLDHGVLIVGYGVSKYPNFNKTLPYWTIKNSWGTGWGEQGYYRIYRGDGSCGVNMMATSATIA